MKDKPQRAKRGGKTLPHFFLYITKDDDKEDYRHNNGVVWGGGRVKGRLWEGSGVRGKYMKVTRNNIISMST